MMGVTELPVHPAADLFPMLSGDDFTALAEDIAEHGLREPVWVWRDEDGVEYLLDGRNRLAACAESGTEVRTQRYTGDDPINFVVSLNIQRRHLSAGQRAMLALELVPLYEEANKKVHAAAVAESNRRRAAERAAEAELTAPPLDGAISSVADLPPMESEPVAPVAKSREKAATATKASGRAVGQAKRVTEKVAVNG